MNCPWCANEIPDGSVFCNHCGTSTVPREKESRTPAVVLWGVAAIVLCGLLYLGLGSWRANRVRAAIFHTPITITNETQNLGAHSWRSIPVLLPYSGSLDVNLQVVRGNPLDVYLVDATGMDMMKLSTDWSTIQGNPNFSAVKTTNYQRSAPLNQGRYYLVMRDTSLGIFSSAATDVDLKIELVP